MQNLVHAGPLGLSGVVRSLLVETLAAPLLPNAIRSAHCCWLLQEVLALAFPATKATETRYVAEHGPVRSAVTVSPLVFLFGRGSSRRRRSAARQ